MACEELGHHALPGPAAESLAAVPALLAALAETGGPPGGRGSCGEWLAGLAAGELIATLAVPPRRPYAADAEAAGLVPAWGSQAEHRARVLREVTGGLT